MRKALLSAAAVTRCFARIIYPEPVRGFLKTDLFARGWLLTAECNRYDLNVFDHDGENLFSQAPQENAADIFPAGIARGGTLRRQLLREQRLDVTITLLWQLESCGEICCSAIK